MPPDGGWVALLETAPNVALPPRFSEVENSFFGNADLLPRLSRRCIDDGAAFQPTENAGEMAMATHHGTQGGTHEQHVHAGQQSHKNASSKADDMKDMDTKADSATHTRGGTHEQHVKAGQQSHKHS
jgi:hypothetical protein